MATTDEKTFLQKYSLHLLQAVTTAVIIFVGKTVMENQREVYEVLAEMRVLSTRLEDLSVLAQDQYRASEAASDLGRIQDIMTTLKDTMDDHLSDHESRIRKLEDVDHLHQRPFDSLQP